MSSNKAFREASAYVHSLGEFGWKLGLERFAELCSRLYDPHRRFRSIHIAGTNGKGSTTAMVSCILQAAGYEVGSYYSPYVYNIRERVQVNGEMIGEDDFARLVSIIRPHASALAKTEHGHPTEFEVKTALGFLYFAERKVDLAVLEVGLGGRLDATNIVTPLVSVITNVTMDHMDRLGNSIAEIAAEKAGIIKENGLVVTAASDPEVLAVIETACEERNADLWRVRVDGSEAMVTASQIPTCSCEHAQSDSRALTPTISQGERANAMGRPAISLHAPTRCCTDLRVAMLGDFQLLNAATAVGVVEALRSIAIDVPERAVREGLASAYIPGRLEVLRERPVLLVDGAHNLDAARSLADALRRRFTYDRLYLIMGMVTGHSIEDVVGELAPLASRFYATQAQSPRAASAQEIAVAARKRCRDVVEVGNVKDAVRLALEDADEDDLICVTGSFYMVNEVPRDHGNKEENT